MTAALSDRDVPQGDLDLDPASTVGWMATLRALFTGTRSTQARQITPVFTVLFIDPPGLRGYWRSTNMG